MLGPRCELCDEAQLQPCVVGLAEEAFPKALSESCHGGPGECDWHECRVLD